MRNTFHFLILLFIFITKDGISQNYVMNGNLDLYAACPTAQGQIHYAYPWTDAAIVGTPDYYNACSSTTSVPYNGVGYQPAFNGTGYAGLFAQQNSIGDNIREYITAPFWQPLQAGTQYNVRFYANLVNTAKSGVATLGAYISSTSTLNMSGWLCTDSPQIINNTLLSDTVNWMMVQGIYTAVGNEQYITIGNFSDDFNCGLQLLYPAGMNSAYYYIDAVSVSPYTGTNEIDAENFLVYTDDLRDQLIIKTPVTKEMNLHIYSLDGRLINKINFEGDFAFDISQLPKSIYMYEISSENIRLKSGKIIRY